LLNFLHFLMNYTDIDAEIDSCSERNPGILLAGRGCREEYEPSPAEPDRRPAEPAPGAAKSRAAVILFCHTQSPDLML
jgi:hypothetical protein